MSFDENVDKNMNKNLSGNYSQKSLDHAKQSAADALKTARAIQKNIYIYAFIYIYPEKREQIIDQLGIIDGIMIMECQKNI